MLDHCPGFYEIEFQRMYRLQGRVLYKLRFWGKQLNCYNKLHEELKADGISPFSLRKRILAKKDEIGKYEKLRSILEEEKEAVSFNNPANATYAEYERIIQDAYERAYANQQ